LSKTHFILHPFAVAKHPGNCELRRAWILNGKQAFFHHFNSRHRFLPNAGSVATKT
jgi:hypothetical protein